MKYCRKEDDVFYHTVMTNTKTKTYTKTKTETKKRLLDIKSGWLVVERTRRQGRLASGRTRPSSARTGSGAALSFIFV